MWVHDSHPTSPGKSRLKETGTDASQREVGVLFFFLQARGGISKATIPRRGGESVTTAWIRMVWTDASLSRRFFFFLLSLARRLFLYGVAVVLLASFSVSFDDWPVGVAGVALATQAIRPDVGGKLFALKNLLRYSFSSPPVRFPTCRAAPTVESHKHAQSSAGGDLFFCLNFF